MRIVMTAQGVKKQEFIVVDNNLSSGDPEVVKEAIDSVAKQIKKK